MRLSAETVGKIITRWIDEGIVTDYAHEYGEPGYSFSPSLTDDDTPMVVLGSYWCKCGKMEEMHDYASHRPHLWAQLEDQGVEFHWYDEWTVVSDSGKAYRTNADSYFWQTSIVYSEEYGDYLTPDDDIEQWVQWAANNTSACIPSNVYTGADLIAAGFEQYNGEYESGWHPGQDANPAEITAEINRQYEDVDIVFALDSSGQFDIRFSAYFRRQEGALHKQYIRHYNLADPQPGPDYDPDSLEDLV